jgi:hypothetical protein
VSKCCTNDTTPKCELTLNRLKSTTFSAYLFFIQNNFCAPVQASLARGRHPSGRFKRISGPTSPTTGVEDFRDLAGLPDPLHAQRPGAGSLRSRRCWDSPSSAG